MNPMNPLSDRALPAPKHTEWFADLVADPNLAISEQTIRATFGRAIDYAQAMAVMLQQFVVVVELQTCTVPVTKEETIEDCWGLYLEICEAQGVQPAR